MNYTNKTHKCEQYTRRKSMPLFDNPTAVQVPVQIENLRIVFFVNQNLCTLNAESNSVPHNHHDYELRYFSSGAGSQVISGKKYTLAERECVITKPFEYHWQIWNSAAASTQYNIRFSVKTPSKKNPVEMEAYESLIKFLDTIRTVNDEEGKLLPLFEMLAEEIYARKSGYINMVRTLCTQIMINLIRISDVKLKIFPAEEPKYYGHERRNMDLFFQTKYLTNVRIQDLADEMNVSIRQVNYILNKMYGMSFVQKLTESRLQQAMLQLSQTDKQIAEISHNCGFQNQNYFAKCFQKFYAMTPTEYRKMIRKMS